jgi:hypothetical protein
VNERIVLEGIAEILHWFVDTPTIGGILVTTIYATAFVVFVIVTRWILAGGRVSESEGEEEGAREGL